MLYFTYLGLNLFRVIEYRAYNALFHLFRLVSPHPPPLPPLPFTFPRTASRG